MECKKAEPRDIKAADGTTLDFCAFPGALALMPQHMAAANALTMNGTSLTGLSAAAAAGAVPGMYQIPAAQAWAQPGAQSKIIYELITILYQSIHVHQYLSVSITDRKYSINIDIPIWIPSVSIITKQPFHSEQCHIFKYLSNQNLSINPCSSICSAVTVPISLLYDRSSLSNVGYPDICQITALSLQVSSMLWYISVSLDA